MKNIIDLASIKAAAVKVTPAPVKVYNAVFPGEGEMNLLVNKFKDKTYNISNNILAFKDGDVLYVIPCTPKIASIINESGFTHDVLYVPFADGGSPVENNSRWKEMLAQAEEANGNATPANI